MKTLKIAGKVWLDTRFDKEEELITAIGYIEYAKNINMQNVTCKKCPKLLQ